MEIKNKKLEKILEKEGITDPEIISRRDSRDILTQSINEFFKFSVIEFGLEPVKMIVFKKEIIADKHDYETKTKILMDKIGSDQKLEERVKENYSSRIEKFLRLIKKIMSAPIKRTNTKTIITLTRDYLEARIHNAFVSFPYSLRTKSLINQFTELLSLAKWPDNVPLEQLHQEGYSAALVPDRETLEIARYNALLDLINKFNKKSRDFCKKFNYFYKNFYNLDYVDLTEKPKTKEDLLEELKNNSRMSKVRSLERNKRQFLIHYFYSLPEGNRYNLVYLIDRLTDKISEITYEDSWNRQLWTRLQVAIHPVLERLEQIAISKSIKPEGYKIANHPYKEIQSLLEEIETYYNFRLKFPPSHIQQAMPNSLKQRQNSPL